MMILRRVDKQSATRLLAAKLSQDNHATVVISIGLKVAAGIRKGNEQTSYWSERRDVFSGAVAVRCRLIEEWIRVVFIWQRRGHNAA